MKTVIKNYISDVLPEMIMIFLNLLLLKLFYSNLGTEIYALYQLFSQFFAYLVLAEAGFTSASLVSLYKPIAENNIETINKKLSGIRFIFRIIGTIIILIGILVSFIICFFIKDGNFSNIYVQITFILFLISNSINYFFFTYRILYDAQQKKYIPNIVYQVGAIIRYIVEIIILYLGFSFEVLLISCIICNLFTNIFMRNYALKNNKYISFSKSKDISMLKGTKDLLVHKISGVIANNIDIILISKKLGLTYVAQYSAYNYILNELTKLVSKIGTSLYSIVGVKYYEKKIENVEKNFIQLNSSMFFLASIICSSLIFSYNSFISLFYGDEMLLKDITVFLFIILIYIQIVRITLNTFVNACGLFRETKICTIVEGIINLILSLILIKYFAMNGVLFATMISYLIADFIIKPIVIKRKLHLFTLKQFYCEETKNFGCIVILIIFNLYFFKFKVKNYISWFVISALLFVLNTIVSCLYFKFINRIDWLNKIVRTLRRKNEI